MTLGLAYWILMLLWLVLGIYYTWPIAANGNYGLFGGNILLFLLLLLLGWAQFGAPLKG